MAILAKDMNHGRQYPLVASQAFDYTELESGVGVDAVKLPDGARVIGGAVVIESAFDATVTAGIGDAGSATRYAAAVALDATGLTALTPTGFKVSGDNFVTITASGAVTQGAGYLEVHYVMDGRSNEVVPSYD